MVENFTQTTDYAITKVPDQQAKAEGAKISRCHCDFPRRIHPQTILETQQLVPTHVEHNHTFRP